MMLPVTVEGLLNICKNKRKFRIQFQKLPLVKGNEWILVHNPGSGGASPLCNSTWTIVSIKVLFYSLPTLCFTVALACVDFMNVTMGNVFSRSR